MITIIQQGTEAKFKVEIKNFDMEFGEFKVSLIYGYRRTVVEIQKSQMVTDDEGNYYFGFDTEGMVGKVTARCEWIVPDDDYPDDEQTHVDEQYLCFVVPNPCPQFIACPDCKTDGIVKYTPTDEHHIGTRYMFLCDNRHNRIVTVDGDFLMALKQK